MRRREEAGGGGGGADTELKTKTPHVNVGNKVRFRNHISALPQPNFGDSATKIKHASATNKRRFRNQDRPDSATKKTRFRNQKKTIPQPKQTRFRNQKKDDSGGVGWGGVGWDDNVRAAAFLSLTHLRPHSPWLRLHRSWFQNHPFLVAESSLVSESFPNLEKKLAWVCDGLWCQTSIACQGLFWSRTSFSLKAALPLGCIQC